MTTWTADDFGLGNCRHQFGRVQGTVQPPPPGSDGAFKKIGLKSTEYGSDWNESGLHLLHDV